MSVGLRTEGQRFGVLRRATKGRPAAFLVFRASPLDGLRPSSSREEHLCR